MTFLGLLQHKAVLYTKNGSSIFCKGGWLYAHGIISYAYSYLAVSCIATRYGCATHFALTRRNINYDHENTFSIKVKALFLSEKMELRVFGKRWSHRII